MDLITRTLWSSRGPTETTSKLLLNKLCRNRLTHQCFIKKDLILPSCTISTTMMDDMKSNIGDPQQVELSICSDGLLKLTEETSSEIRQQYFI